MSPQPSLEELSKAFNIEASIAAVDPLAAALGIAAWSFDPQTGSTQIQDATGSIHGSAVWLPKNLPLNILGTYCTVVGVTMTLTQFALLDASFNALAVTPNIAALMQTTGYREAPLGAQFLTPYAGLYYLADLYAGATMPQILRSNAFVNSAQSQLPNGSFRIFNGGGPFGAFPAVVAPTPSGAMRFLYAR